MHFLFPTRVIIYLRGPQISHKIWAPTKVIDDRSTTWRKISLFYPTTFVWNISHSKRNCPRT